MGAGMVLPMDRTQIVELVLNPTGGGGANNQTQFTFGQQANLWGMVTDFVVAYSNEIMPVSPSGNPVVSYANLQSAMLNLYMSNPDNPKGDMGLFIQLPLIEIVRIITTATPAVAATPITYGWVEALPYFVGLTSVQWEKSNVSVPAGLGINTATSFVFMVGYHSPTAEETNALTTGKRLPFNYKNRAVNRSM